MAARPRRSDRGKACNGTPRDALQGPNDPPIGYLREPQGGRRYRVTVWTLGAASSVRGAIAQRAAGEVDCDWYHSQPDGGVLTRREDLELVAEAAEARVNVFAAVVSSPKFGAPFSAENATAILRMKKITSRHVRSLVALAVQKGYDGIEVDWEEMHAKQAPFERVNRVLPHAKTAVSPQKLYMGVPFFGYS